MLGPVFWFPYNLVQTKLLPWSNVEFAFQHTFLICLGTYRNEFFINIAYAKSCLFRPR